MEEKVFRTKSGFCHILPDKIILTRDGIIGNLSKVVVGNNISRILIVYVVISIFLLFSIFDEIQKGNILLPIFYGILVVYLIYGILTSLNNSATPIIERSKIRNILFKKAIQGLTRSRFEVFFENENGKIKKRLILLPGSMTGGPEETEKALQIMNAEGLII